jgi:hypothetical protein
MEPLSLLCKIEAMLLNCALTGPEERALRVQASVLCNLMELTDSARSAVSTPGGLRRVQERACQLECLQGVLYESKELTFISKPFEAIIGESHRIVGQTCRMFKSPRSIRQAIARGEVRSLELTTMISCMQAALWRWQAGSALSAALSRRRQPLERNIICVALGAWKQAVNLGICRDRRHFFIAHRHKF